MLNVGQIYPADDAVAAECSDKISLFLVAAIPRRLDHQLLGFAWIRTSGGALLSRQPK
jgi:hypothetical protein